MKIFSTGVIRNWDAHTIQNEPVDSFELMNRAAKQFTEWFTTVYDSQSPVCIVCGTGNNGGDGVAVGRLLAPSGYKINLLICDFSGHHSTDFDWQIQHLPPELGVSIEWLTSASALSVRSADTVLVDALWGSGLNREPQGDFARVIEWINEQPNEVVAIDLPSGLFADQHTPGDRIVRADRTFTFEVPKLAFFFPENADRVGEWVCQSIELAPDFQKSVPSTFHFVTHEDARKLVRKRSKFDHKGRFGHALLIAGSLGKMGAAVLAARACLRAGVGLLSTRVPRCGIEILQTAVPEAMCTPDPSVEEWSDVPVLQRYAAIGVGCGIGTHSRTEHALEELLHQVTCPLVLDADALNLLAQNPSWWDIVPKNCLLTPHPKEFERLFGPTANDFARNDLQRKMAQERHVFILLKGAYSAVACPDGSCWFNSTGNPGMATGGSGDVLSGILTGLLAQGYDPQSALLLGVYLHGLAGDLAVDALSQQALTAGDMVEWLGAAWRQLQE